MSRAGTGDAATRVRQWLIELREKKGITQGAVATAAGIAQPSYYEIEKGISNPRPDTAKRISAVLGCEWTRFYDDSEQDGGKE